jgi:hypothetical protein
VLVGDLAQRVEPGGGAGLPAGALVRASSASSIRPALASVMFGETWSQYQASEPSGPPGTPPAPPGAGGIRSRQSAEARGASSMKDGSVIWTVMRRAGPASGGFIRLKVKSG